MFEVTYYVALPFIATEDSLAPSEAVECFNPNYAVMRAVAFSHKPGYVGGLAFSRMDDPATGGFPAMSSQVWRRTG